MHAARVPAGHPEGCLEAFAQLYADMADRIAAGRSGTEPPPLPALLPGVEEGARAVQFVNAALRSHGASGAWMRY